MVCMFLLLSLAYYFQIPNNSIAVYIRSMDKNVFTIFLNELFLSFFLIAAPNKAQVDVAINAVNANTSADNER